MKLSYKIGLATSGLMLATGVATTAAAAQASPHQAVAAAATSRPSISSVSFSGYYGYGSPTIPTLTISGSGFGSAAPAGASDNTTGCGTYTANGEVFGSNLYFIDDNYFEAGYSASTGADCIGLTVESWSPTQVVLQFGNAYETYAHWYLDNGDGYAISINGSIFGGTVSGLL